MRFAAILLSAVFLATASISPAEAARRGGFGGAWVGKPRPIITLNAKKGAKRNALTSSKLKKQHPPPASVQNEQPLRTADGKIAKDPLTGKGRRLDHVVIENGKVVKTVETTSRLAPKKAQLAKEDRIIKAGGGYVKDRETKQVLPVNGVSEVVRHK
ncbi:MAG: hypothetical protein KJZ90_03480 [Rhodocyclaceae bacterium]|nr:hypothetical protein [Rhodocyclaceae bacterium]